MLLKVNSLVTGNMSVSHSHAAFYAIHLEFGALKKIPPKNNVDRV